MAVLGLGLGYSLSLYLSSLEHEVMGIDIDPKAWENPRIDPTTEVKVGAWRETVTFSQDYRALRNFMPDFVLVFVATPLKDDRLSVEHVANALLQAHEYAGSRPEYAIMSTLPIGGMKQLRRGFIRSSIVYTPPMVKKHMFLKTFREPPSGWQLFGGEPSVEMLRLFKGAQPGVRQIVAEPETVEWAKLLTNAFLANKIVFANSVRDQLGPLAAKVCDIVNMDPRVGEGYLTPGGPAAGPCLPRDLTELESVSTGDLRHLLTVINAINKTYTLKEVI